MSVSSDCSVCCKHDDAIFVRKTLQTKICTMLASKPLVRNDDEDLHWQGILATYVYRLFSVDHDEQKLFWDCWKSEVYNMMRVRRGYVVAKIWRRMVGMYINKLICVVSAAHLNTF